MRKIQICGQNPSIRDIPHPGPGWERWILGASWEALGAGQWERAFDVHKVEYIQRVRPKALAWYAEQERPIYLVAEVPGIPASVRYPRVEVADLLGERAASAMSSSIDHMMAFALLSYVSEIRLDGVRMLSVEEWVTQRECLAYWIGRAEAMGIVVTTDPVSALCAPERLYGWDEPTGARRAPGQPLPV